MSTNARLRRTAEGASGISTYETTVYRSRTTAVFVCRSLPLIIGVVIAALLVLVVILPMAHSLSAVDSSVPLAP